MRGSGGGVEGGGGGCGGGGCRRGVGGIVVLDIHPLIQEIDIKEQPKLITTYSLSI